jgi:hypothetical protein
MVSAPTAEQSENENGFPDHSHRFLGVSTLANRAAVSRSDVG